MSEIKPTKNLLEFKNVDSILIYSNTNRQVKQLTSEQIQKFTSDWNKSKIRGYSEKQFDSAFLLMCGRGDSNSHAVKH